MDNHVSKVPLTCGTPVSHRTQRVKKLLLFFQCFKNLSLIIWKVYNPFIICFNNIFIPFDYFCCFFRILLFLLKSSNSRFSSIIIESSNNFFISSLALRFVFLLSAKPFHIYKQKISTLVPNLKQTHLSKLIFFKFRSKNLPHLQSFLLFHILFLRFKVLICFRKCTSNSIQNS